MNEIRLSTHFKTFLGLLHARHVEYLLVGGYAVQYYGYARPTRDLDLWTGTHFLNAMKVVDVIQSFGPGLEDLAPEHFQHPNRLIRLQLPPLRVEVLDPVIGAKPLSLHQFAGVQADEIEILTVQAGLDFEECYAGRVVDSLDGVEVNLVSLRALKAIKQAGGRAKDQDDLAHLG